MNNDLKYNLRGVSASKEDVHKAIRDLDKGLFPNAFSKVFPDLFSHDPGNCILMSSDGSGTKSILAYIYAKETGDISVWRGIAQDALVMNLDDLLCTGASGPFYFTSILNRNKNIITADIVSEIVEGNRSFIEKLKNNGIQIIYTGGETADVGDLVRTITVDCSMLTKIRRKDVIDNNITAGNIIVGLASFGKAIYEDEYNSGIGSNGLTSARHDVLTKYYASNFQETIDPSTPENLIYIGKHDLNEKLTDEFNIGKALLSPTRTYAPVIKEVLEKLSSINAIIHCTGGGQTKVLHYINKNRVIKDNLFKPPPVFELIQKSAGTGYREMFQVYNMGHRMEFYVQDEVSANQIMNIASKYNIDSRIIGRVEESENAEVIIQFNSEEILYSKENV